MDLDSLWAVLVHFNPKQTYRVMAAPSKCFSNTSLESNRYEAWKDRRSSICWYFMIYVNNLRARNRGIDDTLRKLYLYISCNGIYRVPRKKKKRRRKTYSVIIRLMCEIMFNNSRPNKIALSMVRCRKAVCSPLWVQLVLLACYVPVNVVGIVMMSRSQETILVLLFKHFIIYLKLLKTLWSGALFIVADYIILIFWNTIFSSKDFLDANDDISSK